MTESFSSSIGPTDEEVEAWAARERERRAQWSKGPTPEQAALWASRERDRRVAEPGEVSDARSPAAAPEPSMREAARNVQLAAEGAWSLLFKASVKTLNRLVEAGQAWEDSLMEPAPHDRREPPAHTP
jgi:hypothetical protein